MVTAVHRCFVMILKIFVILLGFKRMKRETDIGEPCSALSYGSQGSKRYIYFTCTSGEFICLDDSDYKVSLIGDVHIFAEYLFIVRIISQQT